MAWSAHAGCLRSALYLVNDGLPAFYDPFGHRGVTKLNEVRCCRKVMRMWRCKSVYPIDLGYYDVACVAAPCMPHDNNLATLT